MYVYQKIADIHFQPSCVRFRRRFSVSQQHLKQV